MLGYAQSYDAWDTYDAWRGIRQSQRRLFIELVLLNIVPISNFAWIFSALADVTIDFGWNATNCLTILLVVFLSFITIGYYRVYVALLYKYPRAFYRSKKRLEYFTKPDEYGEPVSFGAQFWPGVIYTLLPNALLFFFLSLRNISIPSFKLDLLLENSILLAVVIIEFAFILVLSIVVRRRRRQIHRTSTT